MIRQVVFMCAIFVQIGIFLSQHVLCSQPSMTHRRPHPFVHHNGSALASSIELRPRPFLAHISSLFRRSRPSEQKEIELARQGRQEPSVVEVATGQDRRVCLFTLFTSLLVLIHIAAYICLPTTQENERDRRSSTKSISSIVASSSPCYRFNIYDCRHRWTCRRHSLSSCCHRQKP